MQQICNYFEAFKHILILVISKAWWLLNSDFGTAATGAFFGAAGGYCLVALNKSRDEILKKLENLRVAIAVAFSLFNVSYSLNKQNIYDLYHKYEEDKKKFVELSPDKDNPIAIEFDHRIVRMPYIDFNLTTSKLFSECGSNSRALILATTLIRCLNDLQEQLEYRLVVLQEITQIVNENGLTAYQKACFYYGVKIEGLQGNIHYENYSDVMKSIKLSTEDCIWFSKELSLEFIENSKKISRRIFFGRPKTPSLEYSDVDARYMPCDDNYKDYREKFKKA